MIDWNRLGLEAEGLLVIDLCETEDGERYLDYRRAGDPVANCDFLIDTESTTKTNLQAWRFAGLETRLRLSNGERFWFDEAGYWQTGAVYERIGCIDRSWVGSIDGLVPEESAVQSAVAHGKRIGLAPFHVDFATLLNEDGRPVWFVSLRFDDQDEEKLNNFPAPVVNVDARTGETSSIKGL